MYLYLYIFINIYLITFLLFQLFSFILIVILYSDADVAMGEREVCVPSCCLEPRPGWVLWWVFCFCSCFSLCCLVCGLCSLDSVCVGVP